MVQNLFCYRMYIYISLDLEQDSNFQWQNQDRFFAWWGGGDTDPLETLIFNPIFYHFFKKTKNHKLKKILGSH